MSQWKQLLEGLEQNPGRADLASGVLCVCRTMQNPIEQSGLLTACAVLILPVQPLAGLHMLRLALLLAPRHPHALQVAREIFRRRGRWAAEQRVTEFAATLTNATAVSPPSESISLMTAQMDNSEIDSGDTVDAVRPIIGSSAKDIEIFRPTESLGFSFDSDMPTLPVAEKTPENMNTSPSAEVDFSFDTLPDRVPDSPENNAENNAVTETTGFGVETENQGYDLELESAKYEVEIEIQKYEVDADSAVSAAATDESVATAVEQDAESHSGEDLFESSPALEELDNLKSINFFEVFLDKCSYDRSWLKFSTGFSPNLAGLVAYVNLLVTMKVIDESDTAKVAVVLYKIIKDTENHEEAEKLFERLFVNRKSGGAL